MTSHALMYSTILVHLNAKIKASAESAVWTFYTTEL